MRHVALLLLSDHTWLPAAEPARCRRADRDVSIAALESGLSVSERYADLVKCGGHTLLITRLQPDLHAFEWMTVVRTWMNDSA